jgi:metal-responsive CopG/Arc/MetJ family transcriptional regulator
MSTATEETSTVRMVSVPMPETLAAAVRELAELEGNRSVASLGRQAFREYLAKRQPRVQEPGSREGSS